MFPTEVVLILTGAFCIGFPLSLAVEWKLSRRRAMLRDIDAFNNARRIRHVVSPFDHESTARPRLHVS